MAGTAEGNHFLKERIWQERQRVIIFCGNEHDGSGREIHFLREGHDGSRERGIYI